MSLNTNASFIYLGLHSNIPFYLFIALSFPFWVDDHLMAVAVPQFTKDPNCKNADMCMVQASGLCFNLGHDPLHRPKQKLGLCLGLLFSYPKSWITWCHNHELFMYGKGVFVCIIVLKNWIRTNLHHKVVKKWKWMTENEYQIIFFLLKTK